LDALQVNNGYNRGRYEVTHAPMDSDLVPSTSAYFQILKERKADLDFIMPQFYNGVTRAHVDGLEGSGGGALSASSMFDSLSNDMFDSEPSKVVFGFCISDCADTGSNVNGNQAVEIMSDLKTINNGEFGCNGGAFFWVAFHDQGGVWSDAVVGEVSKSAGCSTGATTSPMTIKTTSPTTMKTTSAPSLKPTPDLNLEPTPSGNTCCTNRSLGYQTCDTNLWCNQSESNCNTCGGVVTTVPLQRDGCCTWHGDCSNVNPNDNMDCQYKQSDCESDCGGTWQFFHNGNPPPSPTPPSPTPPLGPTAFESAYVTYHNYYEGQSLRETSCSDGENGLMTRWGYDTIDPMAPFVAATSISGWNSPNCGNCYEVVGSASTVYLTAIDQCGAGPEGMMHFDIHPTAFQMLMGDDGVDAGSDYVKFREVSSLKCMGNQG